MTATHGRGPVERFTCSDGIFVGWSHPMELPVVIGEKSRVVAVEGRIRGPGVLFRQDGNVELSRAELTAREFHDLLSALQDTAAAHPGDG